MAYVTNISGTFRPNFLESEIGLITKTYEIPQSMGIADGGYKVVAAGTPFPANDATAVGIVFTDTDVTDDDAAGSVMVAGRVLKERLNLAEAAITALAARGLYVIEGPETVR